MKTNSAIKTIRHIRWILFLFLLLFPFAGCDDDNQSNSFTSYRGTWANDRNEMFKFDLTEGLVVYEDADTTILYTYAISGDSLRLFPGPSSDLNDWKSYLLECGDTYFTLHGFQGAEENVFKKK